MLLACFRHARVVKLVMSAIQVKNVPEELHVAIRRRAAEEGMSVGEYLLDLVRRDLAVMSRRAWFDLIKTREPVLGVDVVKVLDEVRAEEDARIDEWIESRHH